MKYLIKEKGSHDKANYSSQPYKPYPDTGEIFPNRYRAEKKTRWGEDCTHRTTKKH